MLAVPPRKGFDWLAWLLPLAGLAVGAVVVGCARLALEPRRGDEPRRQPRSSSSRWIRSGSSARLDAELARFE